MDDPLNKETADLQKRLAELDRERAALLAALEQLKLRSQTAAQPRLPMQTAGDISTTTTAQSNAEKVTLFHSLFRGRDDVFPAGGKIQIQIRSATLLRATTNGFVVSARSRGSNVATALTRHSCQ